MDDDQRIRLQCPNCNKSVSVPSQYAGKRGKCPGCASIVVIPNHSRAASAVPPPIAAPRLDFEGRKEELARAARVAAAVPVVPVASQAAVTIPQVPVRMNIRMPVGTGNVNFNNGRASHPHMPDPLGVRTGNKLWSVMLFGRGMKETDVSGMDIGKLILMTIQEWEFPNEFTFWTTVGSWSAELPVQTACPLIVRELCSHFAEVDFVHTVPSSSGPGLPQGCILFHVSR